MPGPWPWPCSSLGAIYTATDPMGLSLAQRLLLSNICWGLAEERALVCFPWWTLSLEGKRLLVFGAE